jgi:streptogramin lyase
VSRTTLPAPATGPGPTPHPRGATVVDAIDIGGGEVLGLTTHDDAVWAISFEAGSISRIDPETGDVTLTERLGSGAATVLSAGSQLWVAGYGMAPGASKLYRLDGAGTVQAEVSPGEVCCDLAEGAGRIWAIDPRGDLMGIDPARARVTDRWAVPFDPATHTNVVFGGGSVWVGSDGTPLVQVDPATGAIDRMIETGGGPPFLAKDGLVWGAAPELIWAVDASTGEVVRSFPLEDSMEVISFGIGLGSIWAGIRHPGYVGAVLRLDPSTGDVVADIPDVDIPARIAIGFGSVWVSDSGSSKVYRIDPS